MTQRTPLQKNLEAASAYIEAGNVKKALDSLVAIRELGFTSRDLERNIGLLRDSPGDMTTSLSWLEQTLERVRAEGDDAFKVAQGLGERSMGNMVEGLFDDLGDLFDEPERFFGAEATRRVEPVSAEEDEGSPSLKDRLRLTSNKFKIPAPNLLNPSDLLDTKPGGDAPAEKQTKPFGEPSQPQSNRSREETPVSTVATSRDPIRRPGYDSGVSGLRYAPGVEPEPPHHRLKGADISLELARPSMSRLAAVTDDDDADLDFDLGFESPVPSFGGQKVALGKVEEDDDDFDFGFASPQAVFAPAEPAPAAPSPAAAVAPASKHVDDDLDFDLGFESPMSSFPSPVGTPEPATTPAIEGHSSAASDKNNESAIPAPVVRDPDASSPGQTRPGDSTAALKRSTPASSGPFGGFSLTETSEPIDEREFFELAESMASEASTTSAPSAYRGEPIPRGRVEFADRLAQPTGHEEPSMVEELGAPESSVVGPGTNMSAIMLEARRMFERGDLLGALDICQKIISRQDGNAEAELLSATIEADLVRLHMKRIGSLTRVPRLAIAPSALGSLDLDHRSGFLLSQIDGFSSYEDILEIASMSRPEALKLFVTLLDQGAIVAD